MTAAVGQPHRYPLPQLALARFVGLRTVKSGAAWGAVIGSIVFASAAGFNSIAPSPAQRQVLLASLAANAGLKALLGDTAHIYSIGGFVDWRVGGLVPLLTSVWALLLSTRLMRGDETAGRWEMFLAGQTTARRAAGNALAGLALGVLVMFSVVAACTMIVGTVTAAGFGVGHSLLFAAASVSGAAMFMAIGAVASQLMPTRARAAGLAAVVFGTAFMLRALGDAAPAGHWLVDVSPLGWIEQLHPLAAPSVGWLVPIVGWVLVLSVVTLLLADRDLGTSTIADRDTAPPRTRMLGSPFLFALRLSRASVIGWLAAVLVVSALYGSFAKSAGDAFASSPLLRQFTGNLTGAAQQLGSKIYAGVVFLVLISLLMAYAASAVSNVREQEAHGYLENLVVGAVTRLRWLSGRLAIIVVVIVVGGLLAGVGFWVGASSQDTGLTLGQLLPAGLNATAPALLLAGIAVFALGFLPRSTAVVSYGVLAWSFLVEMIGSAINLNHWLMDTSLLHHVALAPTVNPDWRIVTTYVVLGLLLAVVGAWQFNRRDLQPE